MSNSPRSVPKILHSSANFLVWTFLFAVAYAQSPLYTSNQNQYFLHGFANAGVGFLSQDWLANTLDPTPVFSWIVSLTLRLTGSDILFYIYYALLMGIYLFSLLEIADILFGIRSSPIKTLLFLALVIGVHSAGLRFAFSRTLGVNWTYILEDGVADQRMLGPVLEPSAFAVLLALSVCLFLRRKPYLAVLAAVLAATIHPTYLLSAAMLTFTYMLSTWNEDRKFTRPVALGAVALLAVLPITAYVFASFGGTTPEATARARHILVTYRIPHHAIVAQWFDLTAVVKIGLVLAAIYLMRKTRLFLVLLIPFLAAVLLTLVQILTGSDTLALLFPWRISILLVPLAMTTILSFLVTRWVEWPRARSPRLQRATYMGSTLLIFLSVFIGGIRFKLDLDRKATAAERVVEAYVYTHKSQGDTYLTPVKMQDFRLATGAPVFVEFKSIPYKDSDVLEWYRRIQLADNFYKNPDCQQAQAFAVQEGVSDILMETGGSIPECSFLQQTYRDDAYVVLHVLPSLLSSK